MKRILKWISIVLLPLLILFVLWVGYMASPTKGSKISKYEKPLKALLIVDLQEDCTGPNATPPFPYKNSKELIKNVNRYIIGAEKSNTQVILVGQEFDGLAGTLWSKLFVGGRLMKGLPGTETDKRLNAKKPVKFSKPKGDAFSNPELEKYLAENSVSEVSICGVDAEFCVHLTAKGALNRGLKVNMLMEGIGIMKEQNLEKVTAEYEKEGMNVVR